MEEQVRPVLLARGGALDGASGIGRTHHALVTMLETGQVPGFEFGGVVEHPEGGSGPARLLRRWSGHPRRVRSQAKAAAAAGAAILHITDQEQAGLVPTRRHLPTTVTVHDLFHLDAIQPDADVHIAAGDTSPGFVRRLDLNRVLAGLARADLLICDSEATEARVLHYLPGASTCVVRLGVDLVASDPRTSLQPRPAFLPADGFCLLIVGSEAPRKRLSFLFSALAALPAAVKRDLHLVKVGAESNPERRAQLRSSADAGALTLDWVGRLPEADLIAAYQHAEALLFPSALEGFGFPPLEALGAGCPILAADRPAHNEFIRGAPPPTRLLAHDDPDVWVEAVTELHAAWNERGGPRQPDHGAVDHASQFDHSAHAAAMAAAWSWLLR